MIRALRAKLLLPLLLLTAHGCEQNEARDCPPPPVAEAACRSPLAGRRLAHNGLETIDTAAEPWLNLEAEQAYYFFGRMPREIVLGVLPQEHLSLPQGLRSLAEKELLRLSGVLKLPFVEFELWPSFDEWGLPTWTIARYRLAAAAPWSWLDSNVHAAEAPTGPEDPTVVSLPVFLDPALPEDRRQLFEEEGEDLYQMPGFAYALWTDKSRDELVAAWLAPAKLGPCAPSFSHSGYAAILLDPPARFNGKPYAFHAAVTARGVSWSEPVQWTANSALPRAEGPTTSIVAWPANFTQRFAAAVRVFSGEVTITSPLSGRPIAFDKLGSGQSDNQLLDLVAYLKAGYARYGFAAIGRLEMEEQRFAWRGIPQSNLILRVRGELPPPRNRPVVLSGHIDKAIAEDTFSATGRRLTTPGADDNATALATLHLAAEILVGRYRRSGPAHDIWLVHFTGEEYPGSCLGARHFTSDLLRRRQDIGVTINLDMLGDRTEGDRIFQISPGNQPASFRAAGVALAAALSQGGGWQPTLRHPLERSSYITQTDAAVLDWAGYPTVLFNEHMNLARRVNERYHNSSDRANALDIDYAAAQAKAAIETAVRLAEGR